MISKMHRFKIGVGLQAALLVLALWAVPVWAIGLDQAKAQGWVGETPSGYLGIVRGGAPEEVKKLVQEVNAKRRASYQEIAQRNNTSLKAVEALAGKKAIEKTPSGQYVKLPSGEWVTK